MPRRPPHPPHRRRNLRCPIDRCGCPSWPQTRPLPWCCRRGMRPPYSPPRQAPATLQRRFPLFRPSPMPRAPSCLPVPVPTMPDRYPTSRTHSLTCIKPASGAACFHQSSTCHQKRGRTAMYKNLLVHIPTERSARPAVDGSISLAMSCGAHLDAFATGFETVNNVPFVAEGGAAVASIFEVEHERAMERAQRGSRHFRNRSQERGDQPWQPRGGRDLRRGRCDGRRRGAAL